MDDVPERAPPPEGLGHHDLFLAQVRHMLDVGDRLEVGVAQAQQEVVQLTLTAPHIQEAVS